MGHSITEGVRNKGKQEMFMRGCCTNPLPPLFLQELHARPPASVGIPLRRMTSSPTRPTCDTRNVFLLDVVSTNRLNIIKKDGCIKKNYPAGEKKVFQQNWGNVFICARQPVSVSIVHLLLPEGKLLLLL